MWFILLNLCQILTNISTFIPFGQKKCSDYRYICGRKSVVMEGKYALVTGGSSGMGLEYVRQLADRGWNVIIAALRQDETDVVKAEMDLKYPELDFVSVGMDLAAPDSAEKLFDKVKELRPDAFVEVLINNAGMMCTRYFRTMEPGRISAVMMLHNHTLAMLCRLYLPGMLERKRGYILNVSSLGAWFAYPLLTTYSSTKAFTHTFTKALRLECRGTGVSVADICFGAVDTPLLPVSDKIRKIAKAVHVMITPEKAVRTALKMLFSGHSGKIPGFMNRLWYCFMRHLVPNSLIGWATRKIAERYELS